MAINVTALQSSLEQLIFPIDWKRSLLDGVDVSDVTIIHTPPSGSAAVFGKTIDTPITYIKSPSGLVPGMHYVSIVATTTNPELKPEVYMLIKVDR